MFRMLVRRAVAEKDLVEDEARGHGAEAASSAVETARRRRSFASSGLRVQDRSERRQRRRFKSQPQSQQSVTSRPRYSSRASGGRTVPASREARVKGAELAGEAAAFDPGPRSLDFPEMNQSIPTNARP